MYTYTIYTYIYIYIHIPQRIKALTLPNHNASPATLSAPAFKPFLNGNWQVETGVLFHFVWLQIRDGIFNAATAAGSAAAAAVAATAKAGGQWQLQLQ